MEAVESTTKNDPEKPKMYITRPNASPGYWLCSLLPLAYLSNSFCYPKMSASFEYRLITIVSCGLLLQSVCIFIYLNRIINRSMQILISFVPSMITSLGLFIILQQTMAVSVSWGFLTSLMYCCIYRKLLNAMPKAFTLGEASIAVQGFILFLVNSILQIPNFVKSPPTTRPMELHAIMITGLLCLIVALLLPYFMAFLRKPIFFYPLLFLLVATVFTFPVTRDLPIVTVLNFIVSDLRRIAIVVFYAGLVGVSIATVSWRLQKSEKATTRTRKIFHIMLVLVYLPGLIYQCTLLYIASGVALALIALIETFRLLRMPPLYEALDSAFKIFADEKDCGPIALTPFYLFIGCSITLWISPSACYTTDNAMHNLIPMLSGVLTVGIGDTMASVVGSAIGKHKWPGSVKSIEGSAASILSQFAVLYFLSYCGYIVLMPRSIFTAGFAIVLTSLIEAFTDQIDNLVLPLVFNIVCAKL